MQERIFFFERKRAPDLLHTLTSHFSLKRPITMESLIILLVILAAWIALNRWIFPRMGIPSG